MIGICLKKLQCFGRTALCIECMSRLKSNVPTPKSLHRLLIQKAYKILGLETYFTSGPEETRAWTIQMNSTAPEAAGEIHSDFEKGFIRAETVSYDDFISNEGWVNSKTNGKMRLEGKDYIVQDGDVLNFRFNT